MTSGDGDGTWTKPDDYRPVTRPRSCVSLRRNGDGDLDGLSASLTRRHDCLHRNGDATSGDGDGSVVDRVGLTPTPTTPRRVYAAHRNGDGASTGSHDLRHDCASPQRRCHLRRRRRQRVDQAPRLTLPTANVETIAAADLDGDGDVEGALPQGLLRPSTILCSTSTATAAAADGDGSGGSKTTSPASPANIRYAADRTVTATSTFVASAV